jgi:hypothetical protein
VSKRIGRNDPCPCGSGRKYKLCCLEKDEATERERRAKEESEAPLAPPEPLRPVEPPKATPKHGTRQPWKRNVLNTHGFHKVTTPRKVGS